MTHNACPLPDPNAPELLQAKRIAVVGLSDDPSRPSHYVSQYMKNQGREIIPVNPNLDSVLGLKCYPTLEDIPGRIDLVNVFRLPRFCPAIVESAIKLHAGGVWLQSGIISPESQRLAAEAGLPFVQDHCLMVEHSRHARR